MRSHKHKRAPRLAGVPTLSMPRETTEARPRRIAPLVADGSRAIGADKSTIQQHDLSNLIVGPNQLKHRLSRATKPKSHHKTNTFCPITPVFTGTRYTRPPTTATFPRDKAEESLYNQHVLSILHVGSHQLQYRFFRTSKPKTRHKTNTFCPITPGPRVGPIGGKRTTHWASSSRTSRNAEGPTSRSTPRRIPSTQCTFAQIAPQKIHADAATMADVAFPCMPLL